jgi:hypothetical protein
MGSPESMLVCSGGIPWRRPLPRTLRPGPHLHTQLTRVSWMTYNNVRADERVLFTIRDEWDEMILYETSGRLALYGYALWLVIGHDCGTCL